jgi:hypothetical protein
MGGSRLAEVVLLCDPWASVSAIGGWRCDTTVGEL